MRLCCTEYAIDAGRLGFPRPADIQAFARVASRSELERWIDEHERTGGISFVTARQYPFVVSGDVFASDVRETQTFDVEAADGASRPVTAEVGTRHRVRPRFDPAGIVIAEIELELSGVQTDADGRRGLVSDDLRVERVEIAVGEAVLLGGPYPADGSYVALLTVEVLERGP